MHLNGLGGLGFIHFVSVICKPNFKLVGEWSRGPMEEGPSHACTTQVEKAFCPIYKVFTLYKIGLATNLWKHLKSFIHSFQALVGVPETLKTRFDLSPIHWSICQAHGTAFLFYFKEYVFFLFFFLLLFYLFFLGAALEFFVRYMAEYPHYTNGFAYGNFIMVILWNSLEL